MTAAHQRLVNDMGMHMEHFDIVLEHLGASLEDLKVPPVCMVTSLVILCCKVPTIELTLLKALSQPAVPQHPLDPDHAEPNPVS